MTVHHHALPMSGRDPHEEGRAATMLELLYDLVFVVAFGVAGAQLAHSLAAGHYASGLAAFAFCMFAVIWAWVNFAWFASAYDTDDWVYRVLAMVQMGGLTLLALGIPAIFHSLDEGHYLDNTLLVVGYIIMRVGLIAQWARAYRRDVERRPAIKIYLLTLTIAQVGWVIQAFTHLSIAVVVPFALLLVAIELTGPALAESKVSTPWHPHHIAERYGLLAIIALGEGVVGTIGALEALVSYGWTADAVLLLVSGVGLTFGMWWVYFILPSAEVLHIKRERSFAFGYGHIPLYASIAAVGAGMHVFAYYLDPKHAGFDVHISAVGTLLTVVIPLLVFIISVFVMYHALLRGPGHRLHWLLLGLTLATLAVGVALAAIGVPVTACLTVVAFAPVVTIVGFELRGHAHRIEDVERLAEKG